jgi:hypothetical protein
MMESVSMPFAVCRVCSLSAKYSVVIRDVVAIAAFAIWISAVD